VEGLAVGMGGRGGGGGGGKGGGWWCPALQYIRTNMAASGVEDEARYFH